jgi:hypothetical protein
MFRALNYGMNAQEILETIDKTRRDLALAERRFELLRTLFDLNKNCSRNAAATMKIRILMDSATFEIARLDHDITALTEMLKSRYEEVGANIVSRW